MPRRLLPLAAALLVTIAVLTGSVSSPTYAAAPARHAAGHHAARLSTRDATVLRLVNAARAHARTCGTKHYAAVAPVRANGLLGHAATAYASLMGVRDFFGHVAPDGSDPGDRISGVGYHWKRYGENIAAGYPTPASVVKAWLASPGHCANIMTPFRDIGIGYAAVRGSTYDTYWVLDFGTR